MRIVLVNVSARLSSDGSRLISALLKRAGHKVRIVFMGRPEPLRYSIRELEQLTEVFSDADLAMIAVYSSYAIRAVQVTDFLREKFPGMKVIWGGPHCVSVPELCLRYADGVCFSEGDEAVIDFVNRMEQGKDYEKTPNMAFRVDGKYVINEVLKPFSELDSLPNYDYDLQDHFLLDINLTPMNKEKLRERLAGYPYYIPILYMITSRGCPHMCSYCNNCRYLSMFGRNSVRFYSVDRIIDELKITLNRYSFINFVGFGDDDFFIRPLVQIEEFAEKYKKEIGLPFGVALSADTFSDKKLNLLKSSGLKAIQIGVQSASQRVLNDIYNRKVSINSIKRVIKSVELDCKMRRLDLLLDFIIDNPFEEKDDIIETYKFIINLPYKIKINLFYLSFFPGTPIYQRALNDGLIEPFDENASRFYTRSRLKYQRNYESFLLLFSRALRSRFTTQNETLRLFLSLLGSNMGRSIAALLPDRFYSFMSKVIQ
jgi:anaerobic magnesium-protoporphyrin IX monomethyl ester cyclase